MIPHTRHIVAERMIVIQALTGKQNKDYLLIHLMV